jgi:hypothetical protein
MPLEASAFDGTSFHFSLSLPGMAAYGPSGPRDFSRVEGLLGYVCDVVNAHRQSDTFGLLQQRGQELTELLKAAVEGRLDNPSDEFLADISARFEKGVQWDRRLEHTSGGATFRTGARITSGDGSHALLAVLLMDPKYRQLIRRCPQCGNFFMRDGKRVFCSPECATAVNDAGVLQRQKDQRRRRAAQKLLPQAASNAKRAAAVREAFKSHPEAVTPEQLAAHAKALLQRSRKHK